MNKIAVLPGDGIGPEVMEQSDWKIMDNGTILNECKDPTQSITIEFHCAMAQIV